MRATVQLRTAAAFALALSLGCSNGGEERLLGITTTGEVRGLVKVDANGSREFDPGDDSLPGIRVHLVASGGTDTGLVTTAQADGSFRFRDVPVGVYTLRLDSASFGDSLRTVKVDSARFTVEPDDTVRVNALAGLDLVTTAEARALPAGRRVFVVGVALNDAATYSDTTVHVRDAAGYLRVARLRAPVTTGDSLRLRGTTAVRNGQPVLDDVTPFAVGQGLQPTAAELTTAQAAGAVGGTADAQLVQVRSAVISDTSRTATAFLLTVSDGSGSLVVQLDRVTDGAFQPGSLPGDYVPGNRFDITGILAPTGSGSWRLRPRAASELTYIEPPVISITAARALPAGQKVVVAGVALNGNTTFADTTVHLADASGFVRLTRLRSGVSGGDSVRVRATTAVRNGQVVLDDITVAATLGQGLSPAALALTTAQAASAQGGAADARLVKVTGATISDTVRTPTSFLLTVSDGSGDLVVQLDRVTDGAFQPGSLPGQFVPGNTFDIVGVLAPTGTGTWQLKPRSAAELTFIEPPVISIAAARALPAGQRVVVTGVALNANTTFADTTVHLADASGFVRLTRLRNSVNRGDSVRVRATTALRNGQPVLDDITVTSLGQGLSPSALALTTAQAAAAQGGTADAQLVQVAGATISDTVRTATAFLLTVSDGSGNLVVQLDRVTDGAFQPGSLPGQFVPGNSFDIVGVLAPTGTGTWQLKPRSAAELQFIEPPVISIAAARALPAGRKVVVVGVALNSSSIFADSTVHLADSSGAVRLARLRVSIGQGDSVRVRATTATRNGQPVLDDVTTTSLGQGLFPTAPEITTGVADSAQSGTLDAKMVVIRGATVSDTLRTSTSFILTVDDGSGTVEIQLDRRADPLFQPGALPGEYIPGNKFDIIGVMAPTGTGVWRVKARSSADLIRQ